MAVATLHPTSTVSNTGTVVGAATAHEALSDNSDASYVEFDNLEEAVVGITDLALPGGAIVKRVAIRVRSAYTSGGHPSLTAFSVIDGELISGTLIVTWASPTTLPTFAFKDFPFTDAGIDAATIGLTGQMFGGTGPVRVYDIDLDVTYVPQPVVNVTAPTGTITTDSTPTVTWEMS